MSLGKSLPLSGPHFPLLPSPPLPAANALCGAKVAWEISIFRKPLGWVGCWDPERLPPRVGVIIPGLCSDPSQSDPETKDFWLNMTALTEALQRQAEQNPAASYYNVVLLRYQVD